MHIFRILTPTEAEKLRSTRMGVMINTVLFTHSPKLYKFVPSVIGLDLWRQGCSGKVIQLFSTLGMSLSAPAIRSVGDRVSNDYTAAREEKTQDLVEVS